MFLDEYFRRSLLKVSAFSSDNLCLWLKYLVKRSNLWFLNFSKVHSSNRHFLFNILPLDFLIFHESFNSLFVVIQHNLKVKQVEALNYAIEKFYYNLLFDLCKLRKLWKFTKLFLYFWRQVSKMKLVVCQLLEHFVVPVLSWMDKEVKRHLFNHTSARELGLRLHESLVVQDAFLLSENGLKNFLKLNNWLIWRNLNIWHSIEHKDLLRLQALFSVYLMPQKHLVWLNLSLVDSFLNYLLDLGVFV